MSAVNLPGISRSSLTRSTATATPSTLAGTPASRSKLQQRAADDTVGRNICELYVYSSSEKDIIQYNRLKTVTHRTRTQ